MATKKPAAAKVAASGLAPKRKQTGPSRIVAAAFLRDIANKIGLAVEDPALRAADLRLIADCIEGETHRWRKPESQYSFDWQQQINLAAYQVEHRPARVLVDDVLDMLAQRLATKMGRDTPEAVQKIRQQIVSSRKRQRQQAREQSEKKPGE